MRTFCLLITFHIFASFPIVAQSIQEKSVLRQERFRKVDFMHVGIGMETGGNVNWFVGSKLFAGVGSYRNMVNADIGIGYRFVNLIGSSSNERIMLQQLPVFASLHLNMVRWSKGCAYIGGEAIYCLAVKGDHHIPSSNIAENENVLGKIHATLAGSLGVRLSNWDFSLRYAYDLSPSMNQKFVYESADYDYDCLHSSIFERSYFAFSVSYLLPF